MGFFKLMFCEYPFAHITSIGYYPEPGDTELQAQRYEYSVRAAEGRVQMALLYTWLGGLLYLAAVVICIIFIARKHEDRVYLYLMLAGAAVLLFFAISEREVQFGVERAITDLQFFV